MSSMRYVSAFRALRESQTLWVVCPWQDLLLIPCMHCNCMNVMWQSSSKLKQEEKLQNDYVHENEIHNIFEYNLKSLLHKSTLLQKEPKQWFHFCQFNKLQYLMNCAGGETIASSCSIQKCCCNSIFLFFLHAYLLSFLINILYIVALLHQLKGESSNTLDDTLVAPFLLFLLSL